MPISDLALTPPTEISVAPHQTPDDSPSAPSEDVPGDRVSKAARPVWEFPLTLPNALQMRELLPFSPSKD